MQAFDILIATCVGTAGALLLLLVVKATRPSGLLGRPYVDAPGYKGLPIIGNALMLADYVRNKTGFKLWCRLTEEFGSVASFPALFLNFLIVSDHELSRWILATPEIFTVNQPFRKIFQPFSNGLLVLSGETWKLHRKLLVPTFSPKQLRLALSVVHDRTDDLIAFWKLHHVGRPANVHAHLTAATFDMIGGIAFSYNPGALNAYVSAPYDETKRIELSKSAQLENAMNNAVGGFYSRVPYPSYLWSLVLGSKAEREWRDRITFVRNEIRNVILKRTQARREGFSGEVLDVLDRLLAENEKQEGEKMDDEEVIDEVVMFFFAGHETTANTLVWTLLKLCEHPQVATKLRAELRAVLGPGDCRASYDDLQKLPYLTQVIKETLRLKPVAPVISRTLLKDTTIGGAFAEAGTLVQLNVATIHLDRKIYGPDAEVFRPERWDNGWTPVAGGYLPFGHGSKSCIGEKLAMMELKAILSRILIAFDIDLVLDQSLRAVHSITLGLKEGLLLNLSERTQSDDVVT